MAGKPFLVELEFRNGLPKTQVLTDPRAIGRCGGARMPIAPPLAYDAVMKKVPGGKLITTDKIRSLLARESGADFACPLTCGIFVNIAANASRARAGEDETPYWRTLKKDGELCEKYPDGTQGHKLLLELEGHTVVQKDKRHFVQGYQEKLVELGE